MKQLMKLRPRMVGHSVVEQHVNVLDMPLDGLYRVYEVRAVGPDVYNDGGWVLPVRFQSLENGASGYDGVMESSIAVILEHRLACVAASKPGDAIVARAAQAARQLRELLVLPVAPYKPAQN